MLHFQRHLYNSLGIVIIHKNQIKVLANSKESYYIDTNPMSNNNKMVPILHALQKSLLKSYVVQELQFAKRAIS